MRAACRRLPRNNREREAGDSVEGYFLVGVRMNWPFVSRSAYDTQVRLLERSLDYERERFAVLWEKYDALRVSGANPLPVIPNVTPLPAPKEDELKTMIDEIAGRDYKLRGLMLKQLNADRAAGKSDDKIASAIQRGVPSDGVPI